MTVTVNAAFLRLQVVRYR